MPRTPRAHPASAQRRPLTPQPASRGPGPRGPVRTPGQVAPSPKLAPSPRPAWNPPAGSRDPDAFVARFPATLARRARDLARRAGAEPVRLSVSAAASEVPRQPRDTMDLAGLLRVYEEAVPPSCMADQERTLTTLEALVTARVQPDELAELIARGQARDAWRAVASAELVYALSFGAAGATGLSLAEQPLLQGAPQGPAASGLVQDLNASTAFMLTGGIIAAGGEAAQAAVREGKMGPRYNRAVLDADKACMPYAESPAGQTTQSLSALPFGLLYAADHVAREWLPTPPSVRLVAGAGAAALSALYKLNAATRDGAHLDPTWLDASTPQKAQAMERAIDDLRQGRWAASKGYCANHLLPGLTAVAGQVLSEQGVVRMVGRLAAASLARAGVALAAATGTAGNLYARLGSEGWLGLSWGTLSTWPQRLLAGAARGHARESGASAASPASIKAVVPYPLQPTGALR